MVIAVVMLVVLVKTKRGGGAGGRPGQDAFFLSLVLLVLDGG